MESNKNYKAELPSIIEEIAKSYEEESPLNSGGGFPLPSRATVVKILNDLEAIIYPGYSGEEDAPREYRRYRMSDLVVEVFESLGLQIARSFRHGCPSVREVCDECRGRGEREVTIFLRKIPTLRETLAGDLDAAYDGDPAAKSLDEIMFSYPGLKAVTIYRIAHELHLQNIPLLPRIMTEYAHAITGIDIHPGAVIGRSFFIDHGTGVVIGETSEIGDNVRIYQGVTLGAASVPKDTEGGSPRGKKRHPTIHDNVTIYPNATVLGGDTVIGTGAIVGGNVWLRRSVPSGTTIAIQPPGYRVGGGNWEKMEPNLDSKP